MTLADNFRANLRRLIDADPRPIKAIASLSGYSESYLGRVLSGAKPNPTLLFAECMAETLHTTVTDLLRSDT